MYNRRFQNHVVAVVMLIIESDYYMYKYPEILDITIK